MTSNSPDVAPLPAFQYIAVPNEHVPAVYRLLADLSSVATSPSSEGDPSILRWSDAQLQRLMRREVLTTEIVCEIMDILASDPDTPYSPSDLAEKTGRTASQMSTLGTHISRHLAAHYDTTNWPFESGEGKDFTPRLPGSIYYLLNAQQAEQWRNLRDLTA